MPSHSGFCICPQGEPTFISHLLHTMNKRKHREKPEDTFRHTSIFFCMWLSIRASPNTSPQPQTRTMRENKPLFLVSYLACDIVLWAVVNIPTQESYWVFPQNNPMWQFLSINDQVTVWTQLIMITNSVSLPTFIELFSCYHVSM